MTSSTADAPKLGLPAMAITEAHALLNQPGGQFEVEEREIRGVEIKTWKNAPPTLREVFEVNRPFGPRTYHRATTTSASPSRRIARRSRKLAKRFVADGVKKGDRVAIIMRNLPEWSVAFWAAVLIGAIVTPLNAWWTGPELEYGLTRFRREGRDHGRRALGARARARRQLPRLEAHLCQPLGRRDRRSARASVWRSDRRCRMRGRSSRRWSRRAVALDRPTTTRRSSTPRARRESRRARSSRIATSSRTSSTR